NRIIPDAAAPAGARGTTTALLSACQVHPSRLPPHVATTTLVRQPPPDLMGDRTDLENRCINTKSATKSLWLTVTMSSRGSRVPWCGSATSTPATCRSSTQVPSAGPLMFLQFSTLTNPRPETSLCSTTTNVSALRHLPATCGKLLRGVGTSGTTLTRQT